MITDNLSSHNSAQTRAWMAEHPRLQHVFIPTGACWLNLQEGWWQVFLTAAGMIAFIKSMLVGVFAGLLLALFTLPLLVCTGAGVITFLVSFGVLLKRGSSFLRMAFTQ